MTKTHLDLEQCKNLAAWGMDQELEEGDWCWYKFRNTPDVHRMLIVDFKRDLNFLEQVEHFKIHSLDELLEFARGLDRKWGLLPSDDGWKVARENAASIDDPNPKFAVYKLISKLKEVHDD